MTITPRLNDALAAARHATAMREAIEHPAAAGTAGMAPVAMTPLAPPRAAGVSGISSTSSTSSTLGTTATHGADDGVDAPPADTLPCMVPTVRRELFDRTREELLDLLGRRDLGALPPSWAGVSGRLTQEEAASAAAALQLIAARVSP